jgi:hypothetical protein
MRNSNNVGGLPHGAFGSRRFNLKRSCSNRAAALAIVAKAVQIGLKVILRSQVITPTGLPASQPSMAATVPV